MIDLVLDTPMKVVKAIGEFERLASMLGMPNAERRSILGLSEAAAQSWLSGGTDLDAAVAPALVRRLTYALPLMRRMVANLPLVPVGRMQPASPQPIVH